MSEAVSLPKIEELPFNDNAGRGWGKVKPIVSSLPAVEPFKDIMLPDALSAYVYDVADRQQSPADFVAVSCLCGLAAVVGNGVRVSPKQHDDWQIVPNLWGAIIGRPSAMKSPAMQSALAPIYAIQDDMRKDWQESQKQASIDDVLSALDEKDRKKKAAQAFKGGDREAARALLADSVVDDEDKTPCPRLVVNDATVEKLGELLNQNPRGLLLIRDELAGFLAKMEGDDYQSDRAFYLEAFNGDGQFTYDRIGRGTVHIQNATLSMIGGIQPSRIAPIVSNAMTGKGDDGLVQRLQMAVWPDDVHDWQWTDRLPDRDARQAYEAVFRTLHDNPLGSPENPLVMRFSSSAQLMFREWMEDIQAEARSGNVSGVMESHMLKMPKTIASLALIFELVEGGRFEIGDLATATALVWAEYLISHARRLYAAGQTMAEDGARLIIERRHELPDLFTVRDIHQKRWARLADREAVVSAIEILTDGNYCRALARDTTESGGRPTVCYEWNPELNGEA
ncbi:YfjI family protein [Bartonella tamiae]|uniref:DUF3987 domain-containing protein n=1 Tax=Bartonella tamiae Th239 TaxID=1094558 RepID=J0QWF5_9HYPH|nr:YfjI family protein [Bartonella tamiae]EJF90366.1 hypothetical protein ME5_00767 [Bartonella tamiae Th239]EJF93693.1 hypothetical protein MEG_01117 [Bartonella tamiae Th307]